VGAWDLERKGEKTGENHDRNKTKDKDNEVVGKAAGEEVVDAEEEACTGALALEKIRTSKNKLGLLRVKNTKGLLPLLPPSTSEKLPPSLQFLNPSSHVWFTRTSQMLSLSLTILV